MKYLIGLSLLQTAILAFFGARLIAVDTRMDQMTADITAAAQAPAMITELAQARSTWSARPTGTASTTTPELEDIRYVMREELDQTATRIIAATGPDAKYNTSTVQASVQTNALKKSLENKLQVFVSDGHINEVEMAKFQMSIAKLPADDRKDMLFQLTRAMNSGAVDARF